MRISLPTIPAKGSLYDIAKLRVFDLITLKLFQSAVKIQALQALIISSPFSGYCLSRGSFKALKLFCVFARKYYFFSPRGFHNAWSSFRRNACVGFFNVKLLFRFP